MNHRLTPGAMLLCLAVLAAQVCAAEAVPVGKYKPGAKLPAAWQKTVDELIAEEPRSNIKFVGNAYCPVTGKPVDVSIRPIVVKGKFQKMRDLVAVANEQAHKQIDQWLEGNEGNTRRDRMQIFLKAAKEQLMVTGHHKDEKKWVWDTKPIDLPASAIKQPPKPRDVELTLTVDGAKTHQTIEGLGSATYLYRQGHMDLYAKPETVKYVADDLGFSMIRFNMAPGHFEVKSNPRDISRKDFRFEGTIERPEGMDKSGLYITKNMHNVLDFIQRLQKHNPEIKIIGSVWSPPAWMKTNGKQAGGGSLKPEYYEHFAQYLAEWYRYAEEKYGIKLYAIGPQNELSFKEPYDSCVYKPDDYARLMGIIADTFKREKIDVKVFGPEDMTHVLGRMMSFVKAVMDNPKAAPRLDVIATHGYSDGIESTGSAAESSECWKAIERYKRPYWMTETGYDGDALWGDGGVDGQSMVTGKDKKPHLMPGLLSGIAGRLHYALAYGNASAWTYWQVVAPGYDTHRGRFVLKQFFRFIRPGMVRLEAGPDGGEDGVCVSAWRHPQSKAASVILINRGNDNVKTTLALKLDSPPSTLNVMRTSETEDAVKLPAVKVAGGKAEVTLPPRSVTTLSTLDVR